MAKTLVLAEKPSVGRELAGCLDAGRAAMGICPVGNIL